MKEFDKTFPVTFLGVGANKKPVAKLPAPKRAKSSSEDSSDDSEAEAKKAPPVCL